MKNAPTHSHIHHILTFLKALHLLSLDVVAGAVISSWMFWKLPDGNTTPNPPTLFILGCCTWIIYIFDRLLDNISTQNPTTPRHQFHFENQYYLQILIIGLGFFSLTLLFFIPKQVLWFGIGLSFLLGIYFYILQKTSKNANYQYYKEIFTALLYGTSVVGSAYCTKTRISFEEIILGINFILLVHQSILTFSLYEYEANLSIKNFAGKVGIQRSKFAITSIAVWCFIWLIINYFSSISNYFHSVFLIEFIMSLLTSFLIFFKSFFTKNERYRWFGELVFSTPLFLILL